MIKGKKSRSNYIQTLDGDYNPDDFATISRGDGKCLNCESIIEGSYIDQCLLDKKFEHTLYAVAFKRGQGGLEFRLPIATDVEAIEKVKIKLDSLFLSGLVPEEPFLEGQDT